MSDLRDWLRRHQLEQYADAFEANDIDLDILPELTEERRKELVKVVRHIAEEGRVHIRNVRRDVMESVKKAKFPEDETKRLEKDIQAATDKAIKDIGDHFTAKEKELLAV